MAKFAVGEIAIVARSNHQWYPVGSEVMILSVKSETWTHYQYLIGIEFAPRPRAIYGCDRTLRKRDDPEAPGNWEECPWRPLEEEEIA